MVNLLFISFVHERASGLFVGTIGREGTKQQLLHRELQRRRNCELVGVSSRVSASCQGVNVHHNKVSLQSACDNERNRTMERLLPHAIPKLNDDLEKIKGIKQYKKWEIPR